MTQISAADSKPTTMSEKVRTQIERKWIELIQPKLQLPDNSKEAISWSTRISDPFPNEWPSPTVLTFYAYARGMNLQDVTSGEYVGPLWAKVTVAPTPSSALTFILLTDKIRQSGMQGIRPLSSSERDLFTSDTPSFLTKERSSSSDKLIKSYYCLQLSLGNIPKEIVELHRPFFEWLNCS